MKGKKYVVIGGSSGIGLESVRQIIDAGGEVWAASRTFSEELKSTGAHFIELDVTGSVQALEEISGPIDGLLYCPGSINLRPFKALKIEDFQRDLEVNFLGAVKVVQHFLKQLKESGNSSIVLFSTVAVTQGMGFHSSIAASKGAIEGFARSLAAELASLNIRVNVVAPSLTDTPLASQLLATKEKREASEKRHPLNKIGTAEQLASMATFLLSEKTAWITGQIIHVDGGLSAIKSL
jgi:NAD(P)-dependent dehydrogenase (short-subunit alcohol dehydrogenase family)